MSLVHRPKPTSLSVAASASSSSSSARTRSSIRPRLTSALFRIHAVRRNVALFLGLFELLIKNKNQELLFHDELSRSGGGSVPLKDSEDNSTPSPPCSRNARAQTLPIVLTHHELEGASFATEDLTEWRCCLAFFLLVCVSGQ
jgi:hypothetical protein